MDKLLNNISKYLIYIGVASFVIFFLPGFSSPFYVPKEIFLSIIISLSLIASLTRSIIKGELKFASGKFDVGVMLLGLSYLLSSIFRTPNKMEAFFFPGTTTLILLSIILYLIINQFSKRGKNGVLISLFVSGIFLSLFTLFAKLGILAKIPQLPSFVKEMYFNPSGASLQSVVYLLAVMPIGIIQILKEKDLVKKVFFGVSVAVLVFGIVIVGMDLLPGKPLFPILPSWQTSWSIAVDSLKESPVLGVGPGNYLSAFNLYRPLAYNFTDLWQLRFSSASGFYFTLISEVGLMGLAAMIVLLISIYKVSLGQFKKGSWSVISLVMSIVALLFVPGAQILIFLLMVLLAAFSESENHLTTIATNKIPSAIVATPIFLGIIALGFFGTKAVRAEISYQKSLVALSTNNAQETYDYMVNAVELNPHVDRYHASLAQIEIALANSIAAKEDITDTDRNTITQLVQQAISEGKATVTLNPGRSGNWGVLAQIYRSIMSFADGADQYTVSTYSQAVALDPIDPDLRISLGGDYYALGQYDNAIRAFQLAVAAKNDLANAHYNLASALVANGDYDNAISEMNTVLSLVEPGSADYNTAEATLEQIQKEKPATTETTENLTPPEGLPESKIEPPITLPEEATPPATP